MIAPTLDCITVLRQLWDYLDHELPPERQQAIHHHLATCTGCTEHIEFCRTFLTRIKDTPIDPTELENLRDRITRTLRSEALRSL